ncbi:hypothetical protein HFTV1-gp59 [Haloferax tailed virus 1]|uniref:Uncharacterized protein n=1 Tax=Haloferax tailed virus 1 TaxID=2507575 RepID=A0A410N6X9_HFTV1|nr:hypothetical protein M1M17_gp59 [Haloferax tailed virus 1]QAS68892.1 hypothetical protein HFTV1-gp59 [Haloferax tailed virus 1]
MGRGNRTRQFITCRECGRRAIVIDQHALPPRYCGACQIKREARE